MIDRRQLGWGAAAALMAATGAFAATKPEWHVVLLAGQSNMAGRGKLPEPPDAEASGGADIWMWDPEAGIVPARDPIVHPERGAKPTAVGPGMSFAHAYLSGLKRRNARVLLVGAAWGGTSFGQKVKGLGQRWLATDDVAVGGDLYREAVTRANAALAAAGRTGKASFDAILWHQGESDIQRGDMTAYPEMHSALMQALRTKITGAADAPVVVAEMTPQFLAREGKAVEAIDAGQIARFQAYIHAIDAHIGRAGWVTSQGLSCNAGDPLHFDFASQRELGRRYAVRLVQLMKQRRA
ncbi:MAG: sialate O-acetylesterase [Asticcacaulis sp.]